MELKASFALGSPLALTCSNQWQAWSYCHAEKSRYRLRSYQPSRASGSHGSGPMPVWTAAAGLAVQQVGRQRRLVYQQFASVARQRAAVVPEARESRHPAGPRDELPEPEARRVPSGLKAIMLAFPSGPSSVPSKSPLATSQRRMVLSADPDARSVPSGPKATLLTQPECPSSVASRSPLATSPKAYRCFTVTPRSQARAVRAEGDAVDLARMLQRAQQVPLATSQRRIVVIRP